jgi:hypothetical protein
LSVPLSLFFRSQDDVAMWTKINDCPFWCRRIAEAGMRNGHRFSFNLRKFFSTRRTFSHDCFSLLSNVLGERRVRRVFLNPIVSCQLLSLRFKPSLWLGPSVRDLSSLSKEIRCSGIGSHNNCVRNKHHRDRPPTLGLKVLNTHGG